MRDFDDLKIPYRAVAADIETGEAVVIGDGDMAMAMRASMSIPSLFAPREIDGRLLVDGGVSKNLPIDVVRQMGADVVIAVSQQKTKYLRALHPNTDARWETLTNGYDVEI